MLDSLAATALSDCVAVHQGSLLLVNYYGQSVTVEVDEVVPHGGIIPSRDNAHDVTSLRGRPGEVNELADKFKGEDTLFISGLSFGHFSGNLRVMDLQEF